MFAVKHPLYKTWENMRSRCNNTNTTGYQRYGGRGIYVCSEWNDFWQFVSDMGPKLETYTLDRIDNNGPYAPWNCRWACPTTQGRNRSNNRNLTFKNKTQCLTVWAKELNLRPNTIACRLHRGWSVERALSTT